jgi:hypothetical protein
MNISSQIKIEFKFEF